MAALNYFASFMSLMMPRVLFGLSQIHRPVIREDIASSFGVHGVYCE